MILDWLAYDRVAVDAGEFWRLPGAVFAHLSVGHLLLNLAAGLVTVMVLRRSCRGVDIALAFIVSALVTMVGVHWGSRLDWYAGASSAIIGTIGWGTTRLPRPAALAAAGLLLIGTLLDLGRTTSLLGEPLAPIAHLWGLLGGLGWGLLMSPVARGRPAAGEPPRRCARSAPDSD